MKRHSMKTLKGLVSINTISGHDITAPIRITLEDVDSGCIICQATMTFENYARVISNQSSIDCTIELNTSKTIGKKIEVKREIVLIPEKFKNTNHWDNPQLGEISSNILKPYEVNGWIGRQNDLWNHHNSRGQNLQEVIFERWV